MVRSRPLLLGHRGARVVQSIPENTFASFDLCLAHGCDGFEFDVRATQDGEAVICHDADFAAVRLRDTSLQQLAAFRVQGLLPTLEDVLARYPSCFLDIELKDPGLETRVLHLVSEYPPQGGFVVSSFLPDVLLRLRKLDAEIPLGFIFDKKNTATHASTLPAQFLMPHRSLIDAALVQRAHARGQKVLAWTVNKQEEMLRLAALGIDGLISDETVKMVSAVSSCA